MINKILDLGCNNKKLSNKEKFPGYNFEGEVVGLDIDDVEGVDVVCDLNEGKLPFEDNSFDMVFTYHCLEHIKKARDIIYEVHRVLKKDGYFLVRVPHVSYLESWGSLDHVKLFGYGSFNFIIDNEYHRIRRKEKFKLIKRKIVFGRLYKIIGIEFLANKFPAIYNGFFINIFSAKEFHIELQK